MSRPVTWDQLIQAAEGADTTIAAQGIRAEALTVFVNALVASAGGQILLTQDVPPDQVQLGLVSDAGRAAAEVARSYATSSAAGPGLSTRNEDTSATLFENGTASFMVNWPFVWPRAQSYVEAGTMDPATLQDYGWAIYPRVLADTDAAPPYGGINIGIGAFTRYRDQALDAAQCIVSRENQTYYFISNGNPAALESVYQDQEVLAAYPMADLIRQSLQQAAPRPQTPYYNEVSTCIQRTWHPLESVSPDATPQATTDLITAVLRKEELL
jgi:multiple sugar transport system substrate-binding protein